MPERVASSAADAVAAALEVSYPVVVKTAAPGAHKTETGRYRARSDERRGGRSAVERIGCPVIVQPMISGGTELLAGLVQDPVFGPLVAFGPGGVLAELIGQASFRIAPLTDVDAEELVSEEGGSTRSWILAVRRRQTCRRSSISSNGFRVLDLTCRPLRSWISTSVLDFPMAVSRRRSCAHRAPRDQRADEELVAPQPRGRAPVLHLFKRSVGPTVLRRARLRRGAGHGDPTVKSSAVPLTRACRRPRSRRKPMPARGFYRCGGEPRAGAFR